MVQVRTLSVTAAAPAATYLVKDHVTAAPHYPRRVVKGYLTATEAVTVQFDRGNGFTDAVDMANTDTVDLEVFGPVVGVRINRVAADSVVTMVAVIEG